MHWGTRYARAAMNVGTVRSTEKKRSHSARRWKRRGRKDRSDGPQRTRDLRECLLPLFKKKKPRKSEQQGTIKKRGCGTVTQGSKGEQNKNTMNRDHEFKSGPGTPIKKSAASMGKKNVGRERRGTCSRVVVR